MLTGLVVFSLALAAAGVAVRLYMDRAAENMLRPGEDIAIRDLRDPIPGNAFLVCPPNYCRASAAPSPIFALPAERLAELWSKMLAGEPNIVIVDTEMVEHRLVAIQHTPLLRFPDII